MESPPANKKAAVGKGKTSDEGKGAAASFAASACALNPEMFKGLPRGFDPEGETKAWAKKHPDVSRYAVPDSSSLTTNVAFRQVGMQAPQVLHPLERTSHRVQIV